MNDLKLAEFIALIHHESQQVIEHLAHADQRVVSDASPSSSIVKIEKLQIEIPIKLVPGLSNVRKAAQSKLANLSKPMMLSSGQAVDMRVSIQDTKNLNTTVVESKLRLEFSIASK